MGWHEQFTTTIITMTFSALQDTKHLRGIWPKLDTTKRLTLGAWESSYITWFVVKCHLGAPNSKWGIMWNLKKLNSMIKLGENVHRMLKIWQFNYLAKTSTWDTKSMKFYRMTGYWIPIGLSKNKAINSNSWFKINSWPEVFLDEKFHYFH